MGRLWSVVLLGRLGSREGVLVALPQPPASAPGMWSESPAPGSAERGYRAARAAVQVSIHFKGLLLNF